MIHILFVPGAYGSMLEWGLRNYSQEYNDVIISMLPDGSMHSYKKMYHLFNKKMLLELNNVTLSDNIITTSIYPMQDATSEYIINFLKLKFKKDPKFFIRILNMDMAEINMLMAYKKIAQGSKMNSSFDAFVGGNPPNDVKKWNQTYTHWSKMQNWELREWISIGYPDQLQKNLIDVFKHIDNSWYILTPTEIVESYKMTIKKCISYAGLTYKDNLIADKLVNEWVIEQEKVYKQHSVILKIVQSSIDNIPFEFDKLNLIEEAIIQKRLRDQGYNLRCFNLNVFPTNSYGIHNLIEKNNAELSQ
jgi:hypothetical protein